VIDDGVDVTYLVGGCIGVFRWLVGVAPAEEVERDDPARGKLGNEAIIEVQIVREAVQQHDRRLIARMVACAEMVLAERHTMLPVATPAVQSYFGGNRRLVRLHRILPVLRRVSVVSDAAHRDQRQAEVADLAE